jgi:ribose transport system substrate-binding protein
LFFRAVHAGVDSAAREFALDYQWNGPNDETEHARQIQIVDSMVAQRLDAIAISATDERALAAPVQRAIRAGIPVAVFDSAVNADGFVTFVATGNHAAGCTAARRMAALLSGRGKVGMVMQKPGGTSTGLRESGFLETISTEFPRISIAARQYGMADPARSRAAAENILTAHPDLAGLFASSEAASIGAIQAIRSRSLAGKVRLITFDSSDLHVDALRDGAVDLMLVQDPFRIGYEAVKSLAAVLAGRRPAPRIDLPALEVDKAGLADPAIRAVLFPLRN